MAITDVRKRKIGNELIDWVYLGIRTGARRACVEYRQQVANGNTAAGILALKRGVDLPHRARVRITDAITRFGGAAVAVPFLNECLVLTGTGVTVSALDSELTILENYAQGLVTKKNVQGQTWDQLASDIEAAVAYEGMDWLFPIPVGYVDIWGE